MLNSKERAKLRSYASKLDATVIIGKDGLNDNVLTLIKKGLESKELVKVSVLDSAELSAKDYLIESSEKLGAEQVCSIGRKFCLYKYSTKKGVKHIEF